MLVSEKIEQQISNRPATHLGYIDGCRGLAVSAVLLFHASVWAKTPYCPLIQNVIALIGRAGVDLFLVLSGFCLTWPLVSRIPQGVVTLTLKDFIVRRVRRIIPPYYVALLMAVIASAAVYRFGRQTWGDQPFQDFFPLSYDASSINVFSHLTLFHGFTTYDHSIDGAFWSLSLEWQFYFLFPVLMWIAHRWSCSTAFATTTMITLLFRLGVKLHDSSLVWHSHFNETVFARWAEFGAGVLLADIIRSGTVAKCPAWSLDIGSMVALCGSVCVSFFRGNFFLWPMVWGGVAFTIVLAASCPSSVINRVLSCRVAMHIGDISYSLYLTHGSIFMLLSVPLSRMHADPQTRALVYCTLGIGLAYVSAIGLHTLVERPFLNRKRKNLTVTRVLATEAEVS